MLTGEHNEEEESVKSLGTVKNAKERVKKYSKGSPAIMSSIEAAIRTLDYYKLRTHVHLPPRLVELSLKINRVDRNSIIAEPTAPGVNLTVLITIPDQLLDVAKRTLQPGEQVPDLLCELKDYYQSQSRIEVRYVVQHAFLRKQVDHGISLSLISSLFSPIRPPPLTTAICVCGSFDGPDLHPGAYRFNVLSCAQIPTLSILLDRAHQHIDTDSHYMYHLRIHHISDHPNPYSFAVESASPPFILNNRIRIRPSEDPLVGAFIHQTRPSSPNDVHPPFVAPPFPSKEYEESFFSRPRHPGLIVNQNEFVSNYFASLSLSTYIGNTGKNN